MTPDDDRTAEEKLADELAAELEAEFREFVEETNPKPAQPKDGQKGGSGSGKTSGGATGSGPSAAAASTAPPTTPSSSKVPEAKPIEASAEGLAKAKEQAKKATEGNVEKALGSLAAKSPTAFTRHPIVSVLGHVDHGKTSILDKIRGTKVFDREAGAITQHIGASEVPLDTIYQRCGVILKGKKFTTPGLLFIDTPGHHAFSSLRRRGGALADIAVLVVDMTEGLMPQTIEAIQILRSTKTPFVIAANKVDRCEGWRTADKPFILNVRDQDARALASFDEHFYKLIGALYDQKLPADRYDRVGDFTKNIAIVPTCAQSGEGIPDLLAMLVGLAQRFLESRLETDENTPGEGTVMEVKEDKGLGTVLDVILYAGQVHKDDYILLGTHGEPKQTRIKALLKPAPLDEMRDARKAFRNVEAITAASGIRLVVPDAEGVVAGGPMRVLVSPGRPKISLVDATGHDTVGRADDAGKGAGLAGPATALPATGPTKSGQAPTKPATPVGSSKAAPLAVWTQDEADEANNAAYDAVSKASRPQVELSESGVFVKADTIGGLEALALLLKERGIPIRRAEVGDVSRRDVVEAAAMTDPLYRILLAFNVKMLPDVEVEAQTRELAVFTDRIIYSLLDRHEAWLKEAKGRLDAANREQHIHPCKIKFLEGCSFRARDPAVFGVRVLAGRLLSGRRLIREDGKPIGNVKSIQKDKKSVEEAKLGDEVAISVHGPTIGRQIAEGDILHMDIPESDAKWLLTKGDITAEEKDVLMELIRVRRKEDRYWGL